MAKTTKLTLYRRNKARVAYTRAFFAYIYMKNEWKGHLAWLS
ncbi:hypothetical protein bthur0012_59020 [Bacillus thuringiensis serovar pulsiensis BGSC 4CC1]|nr:hypothetical protein bthur0012_59020 [Bacillus thuringiensis serovar pulsiensis BGSC 4CC1]